ncbi:MAG: alpha-glucosidase [Spirochaetes bacterium]|nr:alpha-glucosidase [Spirochaetota bacterium]
MSEWIWWKHGVIYHIYVRSFYDSNADGVGDIPGILEKIDYLTWLGVDAILLSPVNTSPMHDFGYDICDYRGIDPIFGTIDDFMRLLEEAHARNMRVIMDVALNHTSYLHPWFVESSSSRDNPKRDWYIWRDPVKGGPPNNWRSAFLGSAWEWHPQTGQYYLHTFLKEQPDVNWRNPELEKAMFDELRFWLDKGVDGFRLDVANYFVKDKLFRNNPFSLNPISNQVEKYNKNRPETHAVMRRLRQLVDSFDGDRMLVGEIFSYPPGDSELSASFLGSGNDELHLAFDFSLLYRKWDARKFYKCIKNWYAVLPDGGWPCNVLSNHDQPRSFNRDKDDENSEKRARVAAMLLLTLWGTPFVYYGEEIGMKNFRISRSELADPAGKKFWPIYAGRDCARTPMQWSDEENAGFTKGKMWLPVSMDYKKVNVATQRCDPYSLLNFYRNLIAIRKQKKALTHGSWKALNKGHHGVLSYLRRFEDQTIFVVLNFTDRHQTIHNGRHGQWKVLLSTHRSPFEHFAELSMTLYPYEATMIEKIGELQ